MPHTCSRHGISLACHRMIARAHAADSGCEAMPSHVRLWGCADPPLPTSFHVGCHGNRRAAACCGCTESPRVSHGTIVGDASDCRAIFPSPQRVCQRGVWATGLIALTLFFRLHFILPTSCFRLRMRHASYVRLFGVLRRCGLRCGGVIGFSFFDCSDEFGFAGGELFLVFRFAT